jgi:hypothetical protein
MFIDATSERRIELDVDAEDRDGARDAAWALLRATRPTGLVVVELIDVRELDDAAEGEPR